MENKWLEDYPAEPEFVHRQVLETLEKIQEGPAMPVPFKRTRKKAVRWTMVLAATLLVGATAFAAVHYRLPGLLRDRMDPEEAEKLIQTEPEIWQPETLHVSSAVEAQGTRDEVEARPALEDSSPLLDIRETLFDGRKLFIYGVSTENGKKYDLNTDRIYINGVETGPVNTTQFRPGSSCVPENLAQEEGYSFEVDLGNLHLTEDFEVTLPLSVYEKENESGETEAMEAGAAGKPAVRYQN